MNYIIGIDIGGTRIRIGAVSEKENCLIAPCRVESSRCLKEDLNPADVINELICSYIQTEGLEKRKMTGVGIGLPGSVSKDLQTICEIPNISNKFLNHFPIGLKLHEKLQVPVWVDKDVNLLLRTDIRRYSLQSRTVLAVYIGTGIGSAAALGGRILYGAHGYAMDTGHVPMYQAEKKCGCGKIGCAETIGSGKALCEIRDLHFSDTLIENIFTEHGESQLLAEFVKNCAYVPAVLATVFDPDILLLGGGVIEMNGFPEEKLEKYILELSGRAVAGAGMRFLYAEKDDARGVLGAAELVREQMEKSDSGKREVWK